MEKELLLEREADLAVVTLNRPQRMNAINASLRQQFVECMRGLNADETVRAIILKGATPRAFTSGMDLDDAYEVTWDRMIPRMNDQREVLEVVRDMDKPVVSAIDGICLGAGFHIALLSDWRVATPSSLWGQPEVRVGIASIAGPFLMSLYVGQGHNMELALSGEPVTGQRAYEMGFVSTLCESHEVFHIAKERAKQLASMPRLAVRLTKKRMRDLTSPAFNDSFIAATLAQIECLGDGERQSMIQAFLKKREEKLAEQAKQ
ncbi:enoyl-CoA hydratase/isomerase family protein [Caenimonas soli]|uniref:enoyl-CoA hydratase/isomerase family protein n=1 Tax=Caenimonas soli TaxID=2735555 RepID=UPI001551EBDF|nr:enoyl-CoA hydratase/isomerase family protein [Caenimonas soli]NPC58469.1 enoyl-CoA hydratase/isomerase family protein [Caenimonas soli]